MRRRRGQRTAGREELRGTRAGGSLPSASAGQEGRGGRRHALAAWPVDPEGGCVMRDDDQHLIRDASHGSKTTPQSLFPHNALPDQGNGQPQSR
jgi:hypothetical protein